jgi:hypothetical protein
MKKLSVFIGLLLVSLSATAFEVCVNSDRLLGFGFDGQVVKGDPVNKFFFRNYNLVFKPVQTLATGAKLYAVVGAVRAVVPLTDQVSKFLPATQPVHGSAVLAGDKWTINIQGNLVRWPVQLSFATSPDRLNDAVAINETWEIDRGATSGIATRYNGTEVLGRNQSYGDAQPADVSTNYIEIVACN